MNNMLSIF